MENQNNNIVNICNELAKRHPGTGYAIINLPVIFFYDKIGETMIQTFKGSRPEDECNQILSLELTDGKVKFMCPDEQTLQQLITFISECKVKEGERQLKAGEVIPLRGKDDR